MWNNYKINKTISLDNTIIKSAFDFHLSTNNHVLLFYSTVLDNCLLFCKVQINTIISLYLLKDMKY